MSGIGGAIGASIGSMAAGTFGWTAATWSQIGWTAGVLIGTYLFAPPGPDIMQEGPRLSDLKITSSAYGVDIPKVYGAYRISGNIIWALPLQETKHEEVQDEGKGGGGGSSTTIWYTYAATFAVALCEGPIAGIRKIWFGSILVYDDGKFGNGLTSSNVTFYNGTDTQEINWRIQSNKDDTPGYRHIAYVVFSDIQLEDYGNIIPSATCEVIKNGEPTTIQLSSLLTPSMSSSNLYHIDENYIYTVGGYYNNSYTDVQYRFYKTPVSGTFDTKLIGTTYHKNVVCNEGQIDEYNCSINDNVLHSPPFGMQSNRTDATMLALVNNEYQMLTTGMTCCEIFEDVITYIPVSFDDLKQNILINDNDLYFYDLTTDTIGKNSDILISTRTSQNNGTQNKSQIAVYNYNLYIVTVRPSEIEITVYDLELNEINQNVTSRGLTSAFETVYVGIIIVDSDGIHSFRFNTYDKISLDLEYIKYRNDMPIIRNDINSYGYKNGILYILTDTTFGLPPGTFNSSINRYQLNGISNNGIYLSSVIEDLLLDCGLGQNDFNVTEGDSTLVIGYVIPRNMTARAAIEPLLSAYEFSLVEFDHKIVLRKQNQDSIANILEDDLGADTENKLEHNIKQELDSIKSLSIRYANALSDYQTSIQQVRRIDVNAENEIIIELPLALTDTEAKQLAEKMLYRNWEMRQSFSFSLPISYRDLIAGDVVTLILTEYTLEVRVTKITITEDNKILCSGIINNQNSYISNAIGTDTGSNSGELLEQIGPTDFYILDIPTLHNDYLYSEGVYVATTGYTNSWSGCSVYSKSASVDDFSLDLILFGVPVPIGESTTILGDGPTTIWDTNNYVNVVSNIDLTSYSTTMENLLLGNNYILIGNEVLQFQTAIDVSILPTDNIYKLSGLLRGRRGTESETEFHSIGEKFVLLNQNYTFGFIPKTISNISYYNTISFNDSEISDTIELTYTGKNLKPFSVSYVSNKLEIDNSITIDWSKRSRYISGYFNTLPVIDIPERYSIIINNIIERFSTTTTFNYTDTMKIEDGFSISDGFLFEIAQVGIIYGDYIPISYGNYFSEYIKALTPVAFWEFSETGNDTIALDSSNSYDGEYILSPNLDINTLITGEIGTCIKFTKGINDGVRTPVLPVSITSEMSVCFLFKYSDTDNTGSKYIYHMRGTVGYRSISFDNNILSLSNNDGSTNYVQYVFESDVTYLIIMEWDMPNSTGNIYANGILESTGNIGNTTNGKAGSYDYIGYPADIGGDSEGILDKLSVYNRLLTQEEKNNILTNSGV